MWEPRRARPRGDWPSFASCWPSNASISPGNRSRSGRMQLRELVDTVTADEPPMAHSVDDIVAAGRRAERRRRTGFASAGAAGLVAVAVAGAFMLPSAGAEQNTTAKPGIAGTASKGGDVRWADAGPFTFTFRGYDA